MKSNLDVYFYCNLICSSCVISGENRIQFTRTIFVKHILHFIILCLAYNALSFDGEWVRGSCQGEIVCDGQRPAKGINERLFCNQ